MSLKCGFICARKSLLTSGCVALNMGFTGIISLSSHSAEWVCFLASCFSGYSYTWWSNNAFLLIPKDFRLLAQCFLLLSPGSLPRFTTYKISCVHIISFSFCCWTNRLAQTTPYALSVLSTEVDNISFTDSSVGNKNLVGLSKFMLWTWIDSLNLNI